MTDPVHVPVMMEEVFRILNLGPGDAYMDATTGLAGHAMEAARRIDPGGCVIGLDWDADLLALASERLRQSEPVREGRVRAAFRHCDYREAKEKLEEAAEELGIPAMVQGILVDLGVNNHHLEASARGFSIKEEGPLDMRMDRSKGETAAAFLNRATVNQIENVLFNLGDERWARKIAQAVVARRPLKTTADLVDCVLAAVPPAKRDRNIHPARRTFQAVRIHINGELDDLEGAMKGLASCLAPGGALVALSYHSGEDRAVKNAFRSLAESGEGAEVTRRPLVPQESEVAVNPKSRSAKLRAFVRPKGESE